ncbi:unnamed protein product, partial [Symbiodinium sp. CCMP2456]
AHGGRLLWSPQECGQGGGRGEEGHHDLAQGAGDAYPCPYAVRHLRGAGRRGQAASSVAEEGSRKWRWRRR